MKNRVERKVIGFLIFLFLVIITTVSASAAINPQINFQGKITNPDGTNITNGNYSIRFRLYSDPTLDAANTCGANTCTWEETKSVTITDGIFQTALGDTTTLPGSVDFNTNSIYLGIKVGADTEMTPRVRFTASPYAFNSEKVGGLSASQLVQLSPGTQQTGSINVSGSITTASTLAVQGSNAVTLGSTTNVGAILFQDGSINNRTVTINVAALPTASYSLTLPTTAPSVSQCLQSGAATASQLVFGSCTGAPTPTLQQTYTASAAPALITLADAKDLQVVLSDTVTDPNLLINIATGSTGKFAIQGNGVDILSVKSGVISTVNNAAGVLIGDGFSSTDTNLTPLILDSSSTLSETANTCTTTVNNGAMYFNSNTGSMAVRTCIGGAWEDLISTAGAFFTFFGIVPDSGSTPGDIQALATPAVSGPCKVAWASVTTVSVQSCVAYSGGRKVTVSATTLTVSLGTLNQFQHVCLSGPNNQPVLSTTSTEVANLATVSFLTTTGPIVCLADVRVSTTAINGIFDTRVFTTTTKEFGYADVPLPLGVMVKPGATNINRLALPGTAATGFIRGVVVASTGVAYATGGPNVIIATSGLMSVKATAGTLSVTTPVQNSTTVSGYATTAATSANAYANLGITQNTFSSGCTSAITCRSSLLLDLRIR